MEQKTCVKCRLEKSLEQFPKNKHRADGTGRATMCIACLKLHGLEKELRNERALDYYHSLPNVQLRTEHRRLENEARDRNYAEKERIKLMMKVCRRCGHKKVMTDYPRNKYNMLDGEGGRSRICRQCYEEMPDGHLEQGRERARDYHRVMFHAEHARILMMEESSTRYRDKKARQAVQKAESKAVAEVAGIFGKSEKEWATMTPAERQEVLKGMVES